MSFFDRAGIYNHIRKADSRLTEELIRLLAIENQKDSVIADVGAGTGNYAIDLQKRGYRVYAVEPEKAMIQQCKSNDIIWVNSSAEDIDLPDGSVDSVIVINAVHHFNDLRKSLNEMFRILNTGYILFLTFDPVVVANTWFFEYWPCMKSYQEKHYPAINSFTKFIESCTSVTPEVFTFNIPCDFKDVFSMATWKKPHLLLEDEVRKAMSIFNSLDANLLHQGLEELRKDLSTGLWYKKNEELLSKDALDVGCRIVRLKKE